MYGTTNVTAATAGATLAATGFQTFWAVVTGLTLVSAGIVLTRLRPKSEF